MVRKEDLAASQSRVAKDGREEEGNWPLMNRNGLGVRFLKVRNMVLRNCFRVDFTGLALNKALTARALVLKYT